MEDQEKSATGYSYSSGSPVSPVYTHYTDTTAGLENAKVPYTFDYLPYKYLYLPIVDSSLHYVPKLHEDAQHYKNYGHPSSLDIIEQNKIKYGYKKPWYFGGKEGSQHENERHASQGEKGKKGFKQLFGWDEASKGEHNNAKQKGWYGVAGGDKKGHHDEAQHWQANAEEGKSEKGGKFKEANGHKKGEKTSGYHKVYRKDEYKKDHDFYDHADKKGHFDKYGNYDTNHNSDQGGYQKGGHEQYGYHGDNHGNKGYYNKGHYNGEDKGHQAAQGESNFHKNYEEIAKKSGHADTNQYGYNNDGNAAKWKY